MEWTELPALFPGFAKPESWLPLLQKHAEILAQAAPVVRVSSVSGEDAVRRHYAEALELLRIVQTFRATNFDGEHVIDVGSGGGFPGIPFAALLPRARIHLVEPLQKRARLLSQAASELMLTNVEVHPFRAEQAGRSGLRDSASLVTARAVAALPELLEYVAPFAAKGALIALPKGSRLEEELPAAAPALSTLGCEVLAVVPMRPQVSEYGKVLVLKKRRATPPGYPRKPGIAAKSPLAKPII